MQSRAFIDPPKNRVVAVLIDPVDEPLAIDFASSILHVLEMQKPDPVSDSEFNKAFAIVLERYGEAASQIKSIVPFTDRVKQKVNGQIPLCI